MQSLASGWRGVEKNWEALGWGPVYASGFHLTLFPKTGKADTTGDETLVPPSFSIISLVLIPAEQTFKSCPVVNRNALRPGSVGQEGKLKGPSEALSPWWSLWAETEVS